jgi:hypothetical protein
VLARCSSLHGSTLLTTYLHGQYEVTEPDIEAITQATPGILVLSKSEVIVLA